MQSDRLREFIIEVLRNMPDDWLKLTTHRLDSYNEEQAKTEFIREIFGLFEEDNAYAGALGLYD